MANSKRRRRYIISLVLFLFPWGIRRRLLCRIFGFHIDKSARIGLSFIVPRKLIMKKEAYIGHLSVCKGADLLQMEESSRIGNLNWITGKSTSIRSDFFMEEINRKSELVLGPHSAITNRHFIDCIDSVSIGEFTTIAGFRSQILTHSIDLEESRQSCAPIKIGRYCFIGTGCIFLKGSLIPDYSVVGAGSVVIQQHSDQYTLYGGVPARVVKELPADYAYFNRLRGYVI